MAAVLPLVAVLAIGRHALADDEPRTAHPLKGLAIEACDAPVPCALAPDARPMLMLPGDPTWRRDVKITIGWWTGDDAVEPDLDAALSHMLRQEGDDPSGRPAVVLIAMRFKDEEIAEEMKRRIQHRLKRPGVRMERAKRTVLLLAPTERLSKDCESALWREELSRLQRVAN